MTTSGAELMVALKMRDDASKALQGTRKQFDALAKTVRATGVALTAVGGAITAVAGLSIKNFGEMGDEVQKMALRTGFSTEALSELRHALQISGSDIKSFDGYLTRSYHPKGLSLLNSSLALASNSTAAVLWHHSYVSNRRES